MLLLCYAMTPTDSGGGRVGHLEGPLSRNTFLNSTSLPLLNVQSYYAFYATYLGVQTVKGIAIVNIMEVGNIWHAPSWSLRDLFTSCTASLFLPPLSCQDY